MSASPGPPAPPGVAPGAAPDAAAPRAGAARRPRTGRRAAVAVALLAGGGLALEIALTRLLSALYFQPFTYLLLSVALLGLALGAAAAAVRPRARRAAAAARWAALAGVAGAALAPAALALASQPGWGRALTLALVALPYAFTGLALATVFAARPEAAARLYRADLLGAGVAALASVQLIDRLGGVGAMLTAALALALAAPLLAPAASARVRAALAPLACGALLALHAALGWPAVDYARLATPKPITAALAAGGRVVASSWEALARADLVHLPDAAGGAHYLYLDGAAGSLVPDPARPQTWARDVAALAFEAADPQRALVIGPGGGLDLAQARAAGVDELQAVELSRAGVALARTAVPGADPYAPPLTLQLDEGRSALLRSSGRWDLILLSQVVVQASELKGVALSEHALYTVEAFHDYLERLRPGGLVALKLYDEPTLTRALTTAVTALVEAGRAPSEAAAARHLLAVLDARGARATPLLLVGERPFAAAEAVEVARAAERLGLALLFVPELLARPPLDALLAGRLGVAELVAASGLDVSPTRDDRPFFFHFERGLPRALRPLFAGVGALLAAAALALAWRGARLRDPDRRAAGAHWAPLVFAALGAGFMLLEVSLLQRAQLLLGHPAATLAVVLGALLVGAGLGAGASVRLPPGWRGCALAAALGAALFGAWTLAWPALLEALLPLPLAGRAALLALALLPLALPLGAPFPSALQALAGAGRGRAAAPSGDPAAAGAVGTDVALGWAVNGAAGVAGAVAATGIALLWGFTAVAAAALGCYLLAAATAAALARGS